MLLFIASSLNIANKYTKQNLYIDIYIYVCFVLITSQNGNPQSFLYEMSHDPSAFLMQSALGENSLWNSAMLSRVAKPSLIFDEISSAHWFCTLTSAEWLQPQTATWFFLFGFDCLWRFTPNVRQFKAIWKEKAPFRRNQLSKNLTFMCDNQSLDCKHILHVTNYVLEHSRCLHHL